MTKSKKIISLSIVSVLLAVVATITIFILSSKNEPIELAQAPSSETSSEETSSILVKVPDIVAETSVSSEISSSKANEIKVEGSPTSKPVEKPKSQPKVEKPKPPVSSKPTSNPADGDYKEVNGRMLEYWAVDGQWHDIGSVDRKTVLDDGKDRICPICGGITNKDGSTCTCPAVGSMG